MGYAVEEKVEAIKFEYDTPVDCWLSIVAPGKTFSFNSIMLLLTTHHFNIDYSKYYSKISRALNLITFYIIQTWKSVFKITNSSSLLC